MFRKVTIFNGVLGVVNIILGFYHLAIVLPELHTAITILYSWDGIIGMLCVMVGGLGINSFIMEMIGD